eukprot:30676-Chlamydomonas_euryale.AAC.4
MEPMQRQHALDDCIGAVVAAVHVLPTALQEVLHACIGSMAEPLPYLLHGAPIRRPRTPRTRRWRHRRFRRMQGAGTPVARCGGCAPMHCGQPFYDPFFGGGEAASQQLRRDKSERTLSCTWRLPIGGPAWPCFEQH